MGVRLSPLPKSTQFCPGSGALYLSLIFLASLEEVACSNRRSAFAFADSLLLGDQSM